MLMATDLNGIMSRFDEGFKLEEVQLQFKLKSPICKLLVRNNHVFLILKSGTIHRINLDLPEDIITIQISLSAGSFIEDCWIDYLGYHLVMRNSKNEYYYSNKTSNQYYKLSKLKGLNINSISFFDLCVTAKCTGPMILSTRNSLVLEFSIDSFKEMYLKTLMKNKYAIINVQNALATSQEDILIYSIDLFTLDKKLLSFTTKIPKEPASDVCVFQSLMKTDPIIINLQGLTNIAASGKSLSYISNSTLFLTSLIINDSKSFQPQNISIAFKVKSYLLTNYYILVLTKENELVILNQLSLEKLHTVSLKGLDDKIIGFSYDEGQQTYWAYSEYRVYELVIDSEKTGIINSLVKSHMFLEAIEIVNKGSANADKINLLLKSEAYYLLKQKLFTNAIDVFVRTDEPIDKVALKLIDLEDKTMLRDYLLKKLRTTSSYFKAQKIILTTWIAERYAQELNALENKHINFSKTIVSEDFKKPPESHDLQKEFHQFLSFSKADTDRDTIYEILIRHNRCDDYIFFATLMEDYEHVLKYYISHQDWDNALVTLSLKRDYNLAYSSSTVLLCNNPKKTIDTWISLIDVLDPLRLIPALLSYNKMVAIPQHIYPDYNQAVRFLNFLVYQKQSKSNLVLNTLFSILISYPNLPDEKIIIEHLDRLQNETNNNTNGNRKPFSFDFDFIIRLCLKYNRIRSLIFLYSISEKYREAVKLAIDNDLIKDAVSVIDKAVVDNKERKDLWLQVSKKMISKVISNKDFVIQNKEALFKEVLRLNTAKSDSDGIYIVLQYLMRKCELLKINDILPLFPDFIIIDNFKDALVEALEKLSNDLNSLSIAMDDTIKEAEKIHTSITGFQSTNFQVIKPYQSCELCHTILTIRRFIVFPCNHAFHQDCLVKKILSSNDYKTKNAIHELQQKIKHSNKNHEVLSKLKNEIDSLLCKSCFLCSDLKIGEIDEPIIKPADKEIDSWVID